MEQVHKPEEDVRKEKLEALQKAGTESYPSHVSFTHTLAQLHTHFQELEKSEQPVQCVGRIRALRSHGGSTFLDIDDSTEKFQVFVGKDAIDGYDDLIATVDLADFVEVQGTVFTTKRGQESIKAQKIRLISKALLPLPEKWHGLTDTEIRYRARYLDLLSNPSVRKIFEVRSRTISAIREFLDRHEFLEVDTPILQTLAGGATARPFMTHHNALDIDLYLRIAPELFLKRLVVGGLNRVYEIARCFRNEGMDYSHNPEFTQVEFYAAYWDYRELMSFTEKLFAMLMEKVLGSMTVHYEDHVMQFTPPFPVITFRDALIQYANVDLEEYPDRDTLASKAQQLGVDVLAGDGRGKIADALFKQYVRPKLIQPTFLIDHPIELSPLSKQHADNPKYVERFQLICAGVFELCNGFSELNDPLEQESRFKAQEALREEGDDEAQRADEDFVTALKHGMPPAAGIGIGIDRLVMLLTNQHSIKEIILFPTLKPERPESL